MGRFSLVKHIDAPREDVFAKLTDFRNAAANVRSIVRLDVLTEGPVGPVTLGTRLRETRVVSGREATEEMELTRFEPPRGYALTAESCGCRYVTHFDPTPGGGGTDVWLTFEATPLTLGAKLLSPFLRPMLKRCARETGEDLEGLAALLAPGRPT